MKWSRASTALMAAAIAYYAVFIWKTSFMVGSTRYFALLDDAMISMRYARHLVEGLGLVWNPGEPPVEGFTNPLWTLVMAAVHLLPLPPHRLTLVVQGIGAGILVALLVVVHRMAARLVPPQASPLPLIAMALVAFYWPLAYWTLEGMEVGLLALLTTAAGAMLLARRSPALVYALLGAGILVRMDFVVIALTLAGCGALLDPARRVRHVALGAGVVVTVLAVLTVARLAYFHDPLPNTYYLKMTGYPTGLRLIRGAWVLLLSVARSGGLMALLPLGLPFLVRGDGARRLPLLLAPLLAQCAYSVWVGGDAWEDAIPCNRYIVVAMPLLLVAAAWGITALGARLDPRRRLGPLPVVGLTLAAVLTIAPWRATLLLPPMPYAGQNANLVAIGLAVRDLTLPGASVEATGIGTIGYYSERRIVDLLGKCDRHVARLPMHQAVRQNPLTYFFPGHLKWDYGYSIGTLRPDVVAQLWEYSHDAVPYLRDYVPIGLVVGEARVSLAARRGSAFVRWPAEGPR